MLYVQVKLSTGHRWSWFVRVTVEQNGLSAHGLFECRTIRSFALSFPVAKSPQMELSSSWNFRSMGGLVICEPRTGELVICELIVRTTDANLGYNANQKVRTFKRGPYTCLCIRNTEITFITIQNAERNRKSYYHWGAHWYEILLPVRRKKYKGSVVRVSASYRPSSKVVGCGVTVLIFSQGFF